MAIWPDIIEETEKNEDLLCKLDGCYPVFEAMCAYNSGIINGALWFAAKLRHPIRYQYLKDQTSKKNVHQDSYPWWQDCRQLIIYNFIVIQR